MPTVWVGLEAGAHKRELESEKIQKQKLEIGARKCGGNTRTHNPVKPTIT